MLKPVSVKALPNYCLWLAFNDGVSGEVDLSEKLRHDYYKDWEKPGVFENARVHGGAILWGDGIGENAYDLYLRITGKSYDELPAEIQDEATPPGNDWQLAAVDVIPLPDYRLWLAFNDGVSGEVDLAHLAGKGVFKAWDKPDFFEDVRVTSYGTISWNDDIEMGVDSLYLDVTGITWEQLNIIIASHNAADLVPNA